MIVGTVYLFVGAAGIAGPIGVFAAIYLVEYAPSGKVTRVIDQAINNLAGVPSIIIGLFGFTLFSRQLGFGISLMSGWLTLALMILPIVIRGSEEALRIVPQSFKQAALALGAEGVYMGTRFIATEECPVHQNWKQALLGSEAKDTVAIRHGRTSAQERTDVLTEMRFGSVRILLTERARQLQELQASGASPEKIMDLYYAPPSGYEGKEVSRGMISMLYGDLVNGSVATGQVVGLIDDIPTCRELIERIIGDGERILDRLSETD